MHIERSFKVIIFTKIIYKQILKFNGMSIQHYKMIA
jgi:hypothetical protein